MVVPYECDSVLWVRRSVRWSKNGKERTDDRLIVVKEIAETGRRAERWKEIERCMEQID